MARNAGFAAAFPDRQVHTEDLIATGDRVVARAIMHATHTGPLGDVAPTGRRVRLAAPVAHRPSRALQRRVGGSRYGLGRHATRSSVAGFDPGVSTWLTAMTSSSPTP